MANQANKDCFGYKLGNCTVLTDLVCAHRKCSFYKTRKQFHSDRKKYSGISKEK